eukprot:gene27358-36122_t
MDVNGKFFPTDFVNFLVPEKTNLNQHSQQHQQQYNINDNCIVGGGGYICVPGVLGSPPQLCMSTESSSPQSSSSFPPSPVASSAHLSPAVVQHLPQSVQHLPSSWQQTTAAFPSSVAASEVKQQQILPLLYTDTQNIIDNGQFELFNCLTTAADSAWLLPTHLSSSDVAPAILEDNVIAEFMNDNPFGDVSTLATTGANESTKKSVSKKGRVNVESLRQFCKEQMERDSKLPKSLEEQMYWDAIATVNKNATDVCKEYSLVVGSLFGENDFHGAVRQIRGKKTPPFCGFEAILTNVSIMENKLGYDQLHKVNRRESNQKLQIICSFNAEPFSCKFFIEAVVDLLESLKDSNLSGPSSASINTYGRQRAVAMHRQLNASVALQNKKKISDKRKFKEPAPKLIEDFHNDMRSTTMKEAQAQRFNRHLNNDSYEAEAKNFCLLPDLFRKLQAHDPDGYYRVHLEPSKYDIVVDGKTIMKAGTEFQFRDYVYFSSFGRHFFTHSCRILSIDGAHCHRRFKGILLVAVGKDADLSNVVVGHALVPQENKFYWQLFYNALMRVCPQVEYLMSDKAKGLEAIKIKHEQLPTFLNEYGVEIRLVFGLCCLHAMRNAGSKTLFGYARIRNFVRAGSADERAQKLAVLEKRQSHELEYILKRERDHEMGWYFLNKDYGSLPTEGLLETFCTQAKQFSCKRATAQGYLAAGNEVVPSAIHETQKLANWAMLKRWENRMVNVIYYSHLNNVIEYVEFRVSYNKGESSKKVFFYTDTSLPHYKVIKCDCNWTLKEGRPCLHAAFCLKFPNLDNKLTKEKYFNTFCIERKFFYSKAHHVERMVQQYSNMLQFPDWERLVPERILPWEIPPQAVTTVPTYSAYASILEPTFSDDDDGPSEPRKRKRGQGRKKANNETGKIRKEGTSTSTVEEANILGAN